MEDIITCISQYVDELFAWQLSKTLLFRNQQHTHQVVATVRPIGIESHLSGAEWAALLAAAWFHDTGYCYTYHGHEEYSAVLTGRFMRHYQLDTALQQTVFDLINATRISQQPENGLHEIIYDANFYYLARPDYLLSVSLLRQEKAAHLNKTFSDEEWLTQNICLLENHQYFTPYAQQYWEPLKQLNLQRLLNERL